MYRAHASVCKTLGSDDDPTLSGVAIQLPDRQAETVARWMYHRQGLATREIAGRIGLSGRTVRDWLKQGAFPEAQKRRKTQSSFDPFAAYVLKRWQDGEHNGLTLWREIKNQGYTGTDRSVYRYLKTLKQAEVRASLNPERIQKYAVTTAIWLFVRDPKKLDEAEREDLNAFVRPVFHSKRRMISCKIFYRWFTNEKESGWMPGWPGSR